MPIWNILRKALVEIEAVVGRFNPDQFATWLENRNALLSWIQQAESSTSHAAFTEFIQQEVITCEFCAPTDAGTVAITPNSSTAAVGSIVDQSNRYQQLTSACLWENLMPAMREKLMPAIHPSLSSLRAPLSASTLEILNSKRARCWRILVLMRTLKDSPPSEFPVFFLSPSRILGIFSFRNSSV
ncbi:hypothetical protein R1flu_028111 [Riccia fluitans]|uniref:Uncharacterized protein n=1 Tax=Riccia fluitans TaxID=41844 RepID=A0ABD1XPS3_9MARC